MASPCNSGYKRTKGLDLFTPRSSLSSAVAQRMAYDGTPIATVYAGSLRLSEVYCETRDQLSSHVGFPVNEPATDGGAGSAVTTGPCAPLQHSGTATRRLVATSEAAAGASAAAPSGSAHTAARPATPELTRSAAAACRADFDGHDRKGWNSVRVEGIKQ